MKKYSAIGNSKNEAVVEPLLEVKQSYMISIQTGFPAQRHYKLTVSGSTADE